MDEFERRWKLMQDLLGSEARGDARPHYSSGKTLFGIKSEAEEKMERFAKEIEAEYREKRHNEKRAQEDALAHESDVFNEDDRA